LWWSVSLVEKTGVPRENHWPAASHWQTSSHHMTCIDDTSPWTGFELTTLVVIGTDCIGTGNCKSYYHSITTTTGHNEVSDCCLSSKCTTVLLLLDEIMKPVLYYRPAWYLAEKQQIPGLVYLIIPNRDCSSLTIGLLMSVSKICNKLFVKSQIVFLNHKLWFW
jgi:hypothetical protein